MHPTRLAINQSVFVVVLYSFGASLLYSLIKCVTSCITHPTLLSKWYFTQFDHKDEGFFSDYRVFSKKKNLINIFLQSALQLFMYLLFSPRFVYSFYCSVFKFHSCTLSKSTSPGAFTASSKNVPPSSVTPIKSKVPLPVPTLSQPARIIDPQPLCCSTTHRSTHRFLLLNVESFEKGKTT